MHITLSSNPTSRNTQNHACSGGLAARCALFVGLFCSVLLCLFVCVFLRLFSLSDILGKSSGTNFIISCRCALAIEIYERGGKGMEEHIFSGPIPPGKGEVLGCV